ncbi:MAG: substrate-binding domain-containing protein [Clostridia bacterium]|nr:substrate-binding domain-containing protein [Clostridia bacterium]
MKKFVALFLCTALGLTALTACGGQTAPDTDNPITVISREEGSGTRGAFVELFKIEQKNEAGEKIDHTYIGADITNSTSVMMTSVASNANAIGYISLGSLNDTVKALDIDGAAATVENIKNDSYKIARPFNVATKGEVKPQVEDFLNYIASDAGAKVIEEAGYIAVTNGQYTSARPSGKIVIAGSSSVSPLMTKLKEAYAAINPALTIEIQTSDSTTGINSLLDGICDLGMASRGLKDSELAKGAKGIVIAMDGIAVIVNNENACQGLTSEEVQKIFMGEITKWNELGK